MAGQRPAIRLAAREGLNCHARRCGDFQARLGLGLVFLSLEQLQLELFQQRTALRRLPKPLMLQLATLRLLIELDQEVDLVTRRSWSYP